jgi:hypothetical protein
MYMWACVYVCVCSSPPIAMLLLVALMWKEFLPVQE